MTKLLSCQGVLDHCHLATHKSEVGVELIVLVVEARLDALESCIHVVKLRLDRLLMEPMVMLGDGLVLPLEVWCFISSVSLVRPRHGEDKHKCI